MLPLSADVDHGTGSGHKICFADVVALFFILDDVVNERNELVIRGTAMHQAGQIVVPDGEEASPNFSIGGYANPAAVATEWV